jgi:O-antigen/teichoic acid export membrane protein
MNIAIPKNRKELEAHLHDPLFANAYFLMGNTLLSAGAGFFFWIFAARFYPAEDVGLGSALISAMGLLCILSLLGFDIGLIRYLPGEEDKGGMINSCFVMAGLAAALLSVVFLCGLHIWSPALLVLRERA